MQWERDWVPDLRERKRGGQRVWAEERGKESVGGGNQRGNWTVS